MRELEFDDHDRPRLDEFDEEPDPDDYEDEDDKFDIFENEP